MANEDVFHLGVKALLTDPDGKILLLKVNLNELAGYQGDAYWDIPGGRVKRRQSIQETLTREVLEETGLELPTSGDILGATVSNIRIPNGTSDYGLILFVYRCPLRERPAIVLSSEHVDLWWADPQEAASALGTKYPPELTNLVARSQQEVSCISG